MAKPPPGYVIGPMPDVYFTPKGAGPVAWDGTAFSLTVTDTAPPAGYHIEEGAYFTADGQGPYAWDGTNMVLL